MNNNFKLMYLCIRYEAIWKRYMIVHYTNRLWPKIMRFYYGLRDKIKSRNKIAGILLYKLGHRWFNVSLCRFQYEDYLRYRVDEARKEALNFARQLNNT